MKKLSILFAICILSSCGSTTKAIIRNGAESTSTSVTITTNNPTNWNVSPDVTFPKNNPLNNN